jgi:hypothetical protein
LAVGDDCRASGFKVDEAVTAMRKRTLSRFFIRHNITFKKSIRATEQNRPDVARARRR